MLLPSLNQKLIFCVVVLAAAACSPAPTRPAAAPPDARPNPRPNPGRFGRPGVAASIHRILTLLSHHISKKRGEITNYKKRKGGGRATPPKKERRCGVERGAEQKRGASGPETARPPVPPHRPYSGPRTRLPVAVQLLTLSKLTHSHSRARSLARA